MKTLLFVFLVLCSAATVAQPVVFVQQSPTQQTGTILSDSSEEMCQLWFTPNVPFHGATTLDRLKVTIRRGGPNNISPLNWNDAAAEGGLVLDSTFKNLRVVDELGNQLILIPKLSDCAMMTLTTDIYSCEVTFPAITFIPTKTLTTKVDIAPDAGRFGGMTLFPDLRCGCEQTSVPNAVGGNTGTTAFAPSFTLYGAIRPYEWREPLHKDGFE